MSVLLSVSLEYGGYVSPIKLIAFVLLFFAWMPIVNWFHADAQRVRTKVRLWTAAISIAGGASLIIWLLAPFFLIGLLIYLIAVLAVTIAYIMHRNSLVADFEKILTADHIKNLFVNEEKKIAKASKGMGFITANGNEVPFPTPKTPESFAFQTGCEIFEDADWRRASNVTLLPDNDEYSLTYNIDGLATKQPPRDREDIEYFIHYLKQIADLDTDEKRKPQTGTMQAVNNGKRVKWQITTAGSTKGEKVLIRKLEDQEMMKLGDLGLDADQLEALKSIRDKEIGLFITSGPAKSGVTSTFYAMMKNHDPFMNDINTLEKSISSRLDNITQHTYSLSESSTTSYAERLLSIIRMGANVVGCADCDDSETAIIATNAAAKQNRLLHVNIEATSCIKALSSWIKFVKDKDMVMDSIIGIVNQRLVRKLCDDCKQAYKPNPQLLRKFNIPADKIDVFYRPGEIEYDKHGKPLLCEKCQGTGYCGRTGIYETIVIDDELRKRLKEAKTLQDIALCFRKGKMAGIQQRSLKKVIEGVTSINEVIRELSQERKKPKAKPKQS